MRRAPGDGTEEKGRARAWAVVGAMGLHLLAMTLLPERRPAPPVGSAPAVTFEVEAATGEAPEIVRAPDREGIAAPGLPRPAPVRKDAVRRAAEVASSAVDGAPAGEPAIAAPMVFARAATVDLGLGGMNRFLPRSEGQAEAFAQAHERSDALREAMAARDRALGLGPEGPVIAALEDATTSSAAPENGRAVLALTTDDGGELAALVIERSEGDRAGWEGARRIALERLAKKKLRRGAGTTRFEVVSAMKLPGGRDPGLETTVAGTSVGHRGNASRIGVLVPEPRLFRPDMAPGVSASEVLAMGRPRGINAGIEIPVLRVELDPADIGAKAKRIVHAHVLD